MLNCASAMRVQPRSRQCRGLRGNERVVRARVAAFERVQRAFGQRRLERRCRRELRRHRCSVGAKLAISPMPPGRWPRASAIIASFGLSTGIGACRRATASMQGPKAEQVNRMACAPVSTA